jgi:glycine amidinotransferase
MDMITRAIGPDAPAGQVCPVNSHNEWDPLEPSALNVIIADTVSSYLALVRKCLCCTRERLL